MVDVYVKPKEGLLVRDPISKNPLPQGKWTVVPYTPYWRRRVTAQEIEMSKTNPIKPKEKMVETKFPNKELKIGGKTK